MSRINKILGSVTFRRILVIFVVGLVSRSVVNLVFDMNVFKDFNTTISLAYYGFMACFSALVHELPMGVSIQDAEKLGGLPKDNAFFRRSDSSIDSWERSGIVDSRVTSIVRENDRGVSAGVTGLYGDRGFKSKPSAALGGLYSPEHNRDSTSRSDNLGFTRQCKGRFLWTFKQFSSEFGSYKEYSQYLGQDFSIKVELKKIFRKS